MENQITIRSLNFLDIPMMHKAFLSAFSDYTLDFNLTEDRFIKKFIEKLNIDFDHSAGAFLGDEMIAFIFTNIGMFNGRLTAYNGGSGVVPEHRGKKLTVRLYFYLIDKFRSSGVNQCILEVLTHNMPAISCYSLVGFNQSRLLRCFKMDLGEYNSTKGNPHIEMRAKISPNWELYTSFSDGDASYLDQRHMLSKNLSNETLLEAYLEDECVGFAIYQRDLGRISQFGVKKEMRRKGIGAAIFSYLLSQSDTKYLTVLNVDDKDRGTKKFLNKIGFTNKVNQYEMIYKL